MLYGSRGFAVVMGCTAVLGLLSGCGNKGAVCDQTKKAFESLAAQVRTAPAADAARWKQVMDGFATRLDTLARETDDGELKKALGRAAADARDSATGVGDGDTARLQRFVTEQPQRIGNVCS
jgi:hypothetical protein